MRGRAIGHSGPAELLDQIGRGAVGTQPAPAGMAEVTVVGPGPATGLADVRRCASPCRGGLRHRRRERAAWRGTGKSHLLVGLGTAAAQRGWRVRYTLATKLVNELVEAADEKQLAKTIARYGRVDLLCIDELGSMQLDRRGAEMLFQVLTEREETNAIAIVSNQAFSGWINTFTDPRLCAANIAGSPSPA